MRHRALSVTLPLLGSLCAVAALAIAPSIASAKAASDPSGYIEICKTFAAGPTGSPAYQGTFRYTISDGSYSGSASLSALQGGPQVCTAPISVPSGTATVTEVAAPWFSVASITPTQGDPGTVTPSTTMPGVATLTVNPAPSAGDQSLTTTVQYLNDPVTGIVELCKQANANSPSLTGTYTFNITSTDPGVNILDPLTGAYDLPWTTTTTATIQAAGHGLGCSGPITVPAGTVQTVEPGTTYVTSITATSNGSNQITMPATNLGLGTANVKVTAGDTTNQTIVTYTNALSTVKLCKAWTGSTAPTTSFPFAVTSSGPAGPTAVTGSLGLTAGNCQIIGTVRAGTQVNITEGVVSGTKVASIGVNPTTNSQGISPIVPNTLSLPNRTVSVIAGAGETDVTFTDEAADPGTLKICVKPVTNPTAGTVSFTVNGTQTISVNLSSTAVQCTVDPTTMAFNSSVMIAGGALPPPDAFAGTPAVVPTNVWVLEGGVPTATNQASLTASTASTATVLMSENIVTEVTFTVDPPAPVTAPPVTVTPAAPVSVTGTGPVSVGPISVGPTSTPPATLPVVSTSSLVKTPTTTSKTTVSKAVATEIRKLNKQLATTKAEIRTLTHKLSSKHLSKNVRKADNRKLTSLRALQGKLTKELNKLK